MSQCDNDSRPSLCLYVLGPLQGHSEGGTSLTVCSGPVTMTVKHHSGNTRWANYNVTIMAVCVMPVTMAMEH